MPPAGLSKQRVKKKRGNVVRSLMEAREEEVSLPPPSRPAYHLAHAIKRSPSYLFVLIHLCYLHTLVTAFYRYIIWPCLEQHSAPDVFALYTHVRGMTTDLIIKTLLPPQETKRWWRMVPLRSAAAEEKEDNKYMKGQIIVRQLWRSPATMFLLFGAAYFGVNILVTLLRMLYCTLRQTFRIARGRGHEPAVSMYTLCRYGNGYDAMLRLFFSVVELVWFVRFQHHYYDDGGTSYTYQQMSDGAGLFSPTTVKAIAPPPGNAPGARGATGISSMLPLPSFSAGDVFSAAFVKTALVLVIQVVLALTAVLDIQRLFHALVGVRPLSVPNGWECCPLCAQNWKITRKTANKVHMCPQLWTAPGPAPLTPDTSAAPSNSDDDETAGRVAGSGDLVLPSAIDRKLERRAARPGDAFPDPNVAPLWSRLTYSWLSPLLNVALLSPFDTFSSPAPDAFPDGGDALWRAQLTVVSRLPQLQDDWRTTEAIGDPAWLLWKTRRRTPEEEAAIELRRGCLERTFLYLTESIRRVLTNAFIFYFLPPTAPAPVPSSTKTTRYQQAASAAATPQQTRWWRRKPWPFGRADETATAAGTAATADREDSVTSTGKSQPPPRLTPSAMGHGRTAGLDQSPAFTRHRRLSSMFALPNLVASPLALSSSLRTRPARQQRTIKKSLFKLFLEHPCGREYVYRCVPYKLIEDGLSILAPHAVRALVTFLREVGTAVATAPPRKKTGRERYLPAPGERFLGRGLLICAVLILVVFFQVLFFQAYLSHLYAVAMKATTALKTMLLRRALETPIALSAPRDQQQQRDDDSDDDNSDEDENDGDTAATANGEAEAQYDEDDIRGGLLPSTADDINLAASTRLLARPCAPFVSGGGDGDGATADAQGNREAPSPTLNPPLAADVGHSKGSDRVMALHSAAGAAGGSVSSGGGGGGGGGATSSSSPTAAAPAASPFAAENDVVALFTVDAGNCGDALIFLHNVWGHPLIILSSLVSMYSYVGWVSTLVTFSVLVAMIPVNKMSATRVRVAQQQSKDSGTRMGFLNAVLSSMRTVKAMALEGSLWKSIESARLNESDGQKRVVREESVAAGQTELATLLITLACFGTYLLTGGKMDAAVMVPTMAALNVMRFPLWTLPQIFSQVTRGYTSLKRIERYLEGSGSRTMGAGRCGSSASRHSSVGGCVVAGSAEGVDGRTSFTSATPSLAAGYASSFVESVEELCLPAAADAPGLNSTEEALPGAIHCDLCSFAWSQQAVVAHYQQQQQQAVAAALVSVASPRGAPLSPQLFHSNSSSNGAGCFKAVADLSGMLSPLASSPSFADQSSSSNSRLCVLNNVGLHINPGEFVVIQGATGSGKSALLLAMLGELYPVGAAAAVAASGGFAHSPSRARLEARGDSLASYQLPCSARSDSSSTNLDGNSSCTSSPCQPPRRRHVNARRPCGFVLDGRVAYCAEIPWLRNQTIRENIRLLPDAALADSKVDQAWYEKVLDACALTCDLASMPLGDRTIVGESGSKLSGGQRARVALARAVYRRDAADIFLLDDILSALDVEVQKHLIAMVILGLLREEDDGSDSEASKRADRKNKSKQRTDSYDLDWNLEPKRRKKTIVLATHVAAEMLMPDRVFDMQADGTLHEITGRRKPTQEHINLQKEVWRMSAAAVSAKAVKTSPLPAPPASSTSTAVATAAQSPDLLSPSSSQHGAPPPIKTPGDEAAKSIEPGSGKRQVTAAPVKVRNTNSELLSPKRFSLFPNRDDLKRLFIDYMGPRQALTVLMFTFIAQALQTFMDNWLGVWMSLHREEEDESLRARLVRLAMLPIALVKGSAANAPADPHTFSYLVKTLWYGAGADGAGEGGARWWSVVLDVLYHYFVVSQDAVVLQFLFSYALIGITAATFSYLRTRNFFLSYQRITDALQLRAVRRLLQAPVSYFDRVPTSSLLHVLSRDQEIIDHSLGETTQLILFTVFQLSAMICFNAAQHSAFLVVVPLSALLFYHLTLRFLLLTKQVRTLESKLHGRSVTVLKESVRGAVTLRAYGAQSILEMEQEMAEALDAVHTAGSAGLAADRWVALRLECVSIVMTATLALLSVFATCFSERSAKQKVNLVAVAAAAAYAGLGVNSSLSAARSLSLLCRRIGMFQNQYVSADALLHLERDTPKEKETMLGKKKKSQRRAGKAKRRRRGDQDSEEEETGEEEGRGDNESRRSSLSSPGSAGSLSSSFFADSEDDPVSLLGRHSSANRRRASKQEEAPVLMDIRHLSAKYQSHLSWVLRDVAFRVRAGECVGLIGRTGNGKSSIFNALLQLMDVVKGDIFVNVADMGGENAPAAGTERSAVQMRNALRMSPVDLRKHFFELVSQEPLLIQGTCRTNLLLGMDDTVPDSPETEAKLWEVLQKVSLHEMLLAPSAADAATGEEEDAAAAAAAAAAANADEANGPPLEAAAAPGERHGAARTYTQEDTAALLDFPITAGGTNLSAGQRQLLCLARALLHKPQLVLLDEVSSRVDKQTDLLIQRIICEEILRRQKATGAQQGGARSGSTTSSCGVLLIAHRLETIASLCDRVLVIERGRCVADLSISEVRGLEDLEAYL